MVVNFSVIGQYVRQTEIELHNRRSQDKKLVYTNQDIKATEKKIIIAGMYYYFAGIHSNNAIALLCQVIKQR